MALIIVPTMLPLVPGYWMLALACGFMYGLYVGTATVLAGVQIGTISIYVFIRLFARKRAERVCSFFFCFSDHMPFNYYYYYYFDLSFYKRIMIIY
jgi:uncharacterized membrane protein YdjX (TVP38/TMEM64 family)